MSWNCSKVVEHTIMQPTFVRLSGRGSPGRGPHRTIPRLARCGTAHRRVEIVHAHGAGRSGEQDAGPWAGRWRREGRPEAMQLDEDFLRALEYGMPPTGESVWVSIGCSCAHRARIRETILFPLLKPL